MTREQHVELLEVLAGVRGKFLLSGYESDLYDTAAGVNGWKCHRFEIPNHAAGGAEKRKMVECVWANF